MSREEVREEVVVDETEFFVSAIYIGGAFSTGWSHQPVPMDPSNYLFILSELITHLHSSALQFRVSVGIVLLQFLKIVGVG